MASVVQSGGTAAGAGLPSGTFGKTGTAEFGSGNPPPTHAWFIGYRGNVAFAVIVEGGGVGGRVALPRRRDSSTRFPANDYFMLSGMSADGSICPVKIPALKPASASSCVP
jgi:cell division protein FtsI/penicillin-binding protein 2